MVFPSCVYDPEVGVPADALLSLSAAAPRSTRFGGGPNDAGSFNDERGRATRSVRAFDEVESLPMPTQPA